MNHEERFFAVLNGEIPDRVPYTELGGMDSVIIGRHYGYDYGKPSKLMDLLKYIPGWRKLFLKFAENAKIVSSIANRGFELYRLMEYGRNSSSNVPIFRSFLQIMRKKSMGNPIKNLQSQNRERL